MCVNCAYHRQVPIPQNSSNSGVCEDIVLPVGHFVSFTRLPVSILIELSWLGVPVLGNPDDNCCHQEGGGGRLPGTGTPGDYGH